MCVCLDQAGSNLDAAVSCVTLRWVPRPLEKVSRLGLRPEEEDFSFFTSFLEKNKGKLTHGSTQTLVALVGAAGVSRLR